MCQASGVWHILAKSRYGKFAAWVLIKYARSETSVGLAGFLKPDLCRSFAHTDQVLLASRRSEAFWPMVGTPAPKSLHTPLLIKTAQIMRAILLARKGALPSTSCSAGKTASKPTSSATC